MLLLLVLLIWLQYSLWLGKNGIYDYIRINNEIMLQQKSNVQLKMINNQLLAEINDLNDGSEAIEERARSELGMIRLGETLYRLVPNTTDNHEKHSLPNK